MPGMNLTPLSVLRLAAPGAPKLREVARKIKCSAQALSFFEQGRTAIGADLLKKYARAVKSTPKEVRRRFLFASLAYHDSRCREVRREMLALGLKTTKGRRLDLTG